MRARVQRSAVIAFCAAMAAVMLHFHLPEAHPIATLFFWPAVAGFLNGRWIDGAFVPFLGMLLLTHAAIYRGHPSASEIWAVALTGPGFLFMIGSAGALAGTGSLWLCRWVAKLALTAPER